MSEPNKKPQYNGSAFNLYNLTRVRGLEVAHVLASTTQGGTEQPSMNWLVYTQTQERIRLAYAKAASSVFNRKTAANVGGIILACAAIAGLSAAVLWVPLVKGIALAVGVVATLASSMCVYDNLGEDKLHVANQFRSDAPDAVPSASAMGDMKVYRRALKILEKEGLLGKGAFGAQGQGFSGGETDFWGETARFRSPQTALPTGRETLRLVPGTTQRKALEHKAA